jgi:hypothetical protein
MDNNGAISLNQKHFYSSSHLLNAITPARATAHQNIPLLVAPPSTPLQHTAAERHQQQHGPWRTTVASRGLRSISDEPNAIITIKNGYVQPVRPQMAAFLQQMFAHQQYQQQLYTTDNNGQQLLMQNPPNNTTKISRDIE